MTPKKWSDELSVGNEEIDRQHGEIVHLINELSECESSGGPDSEKKFYFLLSSLMLSMTRHFRYEEAQLEKNGCPWIEKHARSHALFVENLSQILAVTENQVSREVVLFLERWLEEHVTREDMRSIQYLK